MKVGIDLSSTNTGLVILSDDNKLIFHGNFQLWNNDKLKMYEKIYDLVFIIKTKTNKNVWSEYQVNIGIELADFKNANITNRFNLLAGMIIFGLLDKKCKSLSDVNCFFPNIKLFNSNEWQKFLLDIYKPDIKCIKEIVGYEKYDDGDGYVDEVPIYKEFYQISYGDKTVKIEKNERTLRKTLSRIFTKQNCLEYQDTWTEDECDAYCIAYFLPQLRDRTQMHQEVKAKRVQAKKSKLAEKNEQIKKWRKENKLRQRQTKYLNILASGKKLTKAQDRALDNAIKELKEMENEKV